MHATSNFETQKTILAGIFFTLLLVLVSSNIPLVGFIASWFVPLPILFYRTRLSRKNAALIPAAIILLLTVADKGISPDVFFFAGLMLLGFLLSESFEKNFSIEKTILFSCGSVLITGCLFLFFYSTISTTDFFENISNYMGQNISLTLELYKEMGMPEDKLSLISESKDEIIFILTRMLPGIAALVTIFTAWINILVAGTIFMKHKISFADFGTLKLWKAPDQLVVVTIVCGIALMLPIETLKLISLNFILILLLIYFFQGIAIVAFYFDKKNFPKGLRILLYGLIVLQSILKIFVIGIGFFDIWVNFRKTGIDKTGTLND